MFDIVFISYNEPNADSNWSLLKSRFPHARRVHGVTGIHRAHKTAAQKLYTTNKIWIVDGDSKISNDFNFVHPNDLWDDAVYVYRAKNPVNGLAYGYGGVKLLPTALTANLNILSTDMTTSISKNFVVVDTIASTTCFNTDPFNAWKSAFRECVKLSSKVINNQVDEETEQRLTAWCSIGKNEPFGEWCIAGAIAGREYGLTNASSQESLKLINNFSWLEELYQKTYQEVS